MAVPAVGLQRKHVAAAFGLKTSNGVDYLRKNGKLRSKHRGKITVWTMKQDRKVEDGLFWHEWRSRNQDTTG